MLCCADGRTHSKYSIETHERKKVVRNWLAVTGNLARFLSIFRKSLNHISGNNAHTAAQNVIIIQRQQQQQSQQQHPKIESLCEYRAYLCAGGTQENEKVVNFSAWPHFDIAIR